MNSEQPIPLSVRTPEKPSDFKGALKDFEQGQLCFVVARRYEGKGAIKLILHKADLNKNDQGEPGFIYGGREHWVVGAGTLMGLTTSAKKALSSRINGQAGGRKKKPLPNAGLQATPHTKREAFDKLCTDFNGKPFRTPLLKPSGKL